MAVVKILETAPGKRVFLMIQNQQNPAAVPGEVGKIGIAFDQSPTRVADCPVQLYPGGSITFDRTVPQNRIFVVSDAAVDMPVGVTVSNMV